MKTKYILLVLLFSLVPLVMIVGCKYDVAAPLWDSPPAQAAPTPVITGIVPADSARPGVNTIMIRGRNFNDSLGGNIVYIDGNAVTVLSNTDSTITVSRPNLAVNAATFSIVSSGAFLVAHYSPYKISAVIQKYGTFLDNVSLSTTAVDSVDNLYVEETGSFKVYKVTPGGTKTVLGTVPWNPIDMRVGPSSNLYFTTGSREIAMLDVKTGTTTTRWRWLSQGRLANYIDFATNGYMYIACSTDLYILSLSTAASSSGITTPTASGLYTSASGHVIVAMHVYNGYLYVADKTDQGQTIYKHLINGNGTLGPQTVVLNWSTSKYSTYTIKDFMFASDLTTLYILTNDGAENLFVSTSQGISSFYKGILPPYGVFCAWSSNSTYLYMISGNTTPAQEWNVYRVDMGAKSAAR